MQQHANTENDENHKYSHSTEDRPLEPVLMSWGSGLRMGCTAAVSPQTLRTPSIL